jgi:hypothetical protein
VQYVEGLNGETACHSRVSTLAAEASRIMRVRLPCYAGPSHPTCLSRLMALWYIFTFAIVCRFN